MASISSSTGSPTSCERSSTIPPRIGRGWPVTDEPSPRAVSGVADARAMSSTARTSSTDRTVTTTSGRCGCRPSFCQTVDTGQVSWLASSSTDAAVDTEAAPSAASSASVAWIVVMTELLRWVVEITIHRSEYSVY